EDIWREDTDRTMYSWVRSLLLALKQKTNKECAATISQAALAILSSGKMAMQHRHPVFGDFDLDKLPLGFFLEEDAEEPAGVPLVSQHGSRPQIKKFFILKYDPNLRAQQLKNRANVLRLDPAAAVIKADEKTIPTATLSSL